jgi:hypothetical protein
LRPNNFFFPTHFREFGHPVYFHTTQKGAFESSGHLFVYLKSTPQTPINFGHFAEIKGLSYLVILVTQALFLAIILP